MGATTTTNYLTSLSKNRGELTIGSVSLCKLQLDLYEELPE